MKISQMEIIPKILIYWYITVFISTGILSYFNFINRSSTVLVNILFFIVILFLYNKKIIVLLKNFLQKHTIYFYIISVILGLTFLQGFLSAPNTTDSMVYHLPRVMYWIQEHTLYQDIIRNDHDFMAPFGEYLILHLYLIFNSDKLLFLSQWLAFVVTIVLSYLIAKQLGAKSEVIKPVVLLVATLPVASLQATSTQTDMITTVLLLFSIYFALIFKESPDVKNSILFGFSIGLGILTKATFVLFLIIPFGILLLSVLRRWRQNFPLVLLSLLIFGIIQVRFIDQNLRLYGNLTVSGYTNEIINIQVILSNIIRNTFLHIPAPFVTNSVQKGIFYTHNLLRLDLNDSKTTYYDTKFQVLQVIFPQEDIVGNPLHLLVIFLAGIFLALKFSKIKLTDKRIHLYLLAIFSFIVFSAILKWQPFHSRLQMPFFMVGSISAMSILSGNRKFTIFLKLLLILTSVLTLVLIVLNVSKPYISYNFFYPYVKYFAPSLSDIPEAFYKRDRDRQYFHARYYWYSPYKGIIKTLKEKNLKLDTIAFQLMDGFEYPLWIFLNESNLNFKIIPVSKKSYNTIILSTSKDPYKIESYKTECIKTEIEYGYACISAKDGNI